MTHTIINADLDALLTETQAAEFLQVSPRTLQAWRVRGGGPRYQKLGRAVRYQRRALVEWLEARTRRSTCEESMT